MGNFDSHRDTTPLRFGSVRPRAQAGIGKKTRGYNPVAHGTISFREIISNDWDIVQRDVRKLGPARARADGPEKVEAFFVRF
jgi:hypothetical protein